MTDESAIEDIEVTKEDLEQCLHSASFWADHIPGYAAQMQNRADFFTIGAGVVAAITGLSIWATVQASVDPLAQAAVGLVAFLATVLALIPKTVGYSDCAVNAAPLGLEYGRATGALRGALHELGENNPDAQKHARAAMAYFHAVKEKKDKLRPFPRRLDEESHRTAPARPPRPRAVVPGPA